MGCVNNSLIKLLDKVSTSYETLSQMHPKTRVGGHPPSAPIDYRTD